MPTYTYPCLVGRQRPADDAPEFCQFFAPAGDVLKWAAVERIRDTRPGFQRMVNPARVRGVKRFFEQDARNTIPTAVILTLRVSADALSPPAEGSPARTLTLTVPDDLPDDRKPGLVIDGQHRLEGARAFDPNTWVPLVALLNPSDTEAAFQFLVINNKSARVPPDHIRKLALNFQPDGLEQRLRAARLSLKKNFALVGQVDEEEGSPFFHLIRWPTPAAEQRPVVPAAVELALQNIDDRGLQPLKDDTDALLEFFYAVWATVRSNWANVWGTAGSTLLSKVGVICLTWYLTDSLAKYYEWGELELTDPVQVAGRTAQLLGNLEPTFWRSGWKEGGGLDTPRGRQQVVDDLTRMALNHRAQLPWFDELRTINRPEPVEA